MRRSFGRSSRWLSCSVSGLALLAAADLLAGGSALAQSCPSDAVICVDNSGAGGRDGKSAGNHNDNGENGQSGRETTTQIPAHGVNSTVHGVTGVLLRSNGGKGGESSDRHNHWGGNGGDGGAITVTARPRMIGGPIPVMPAAPSMSLLAPGLTLLSLGGNGGATSIVTGGHSYGQAGHGGKLTTDLTLSSATVMGHFLWATTAGGSAFDAAARHLAVNEKAGDGGRGGDITSKISAGTITVQGPSMVGAAIGLASSGGNGGGGRGNSVNPNYDGESGVGGAGGRIDLTFSGVLTTTAGGIAASSIGGHGGSGLPAGALSSGSAGGAGGQGGDINIILRGTASHITATGDGTFGVRATSIGGDGGHGSKGHVAGPEGYDGGNGGGTGRITISNAIGITTIGRDSYGIGAFATGGKGGAGGNDHGVIWSSGGNGGSGGSDAAISITNAGAISAGGATPETSENARGIVARSIGGGGATGGSTQGGFVSAGGSGGNAGDGGPVTVTNARSGSVTTHGAFGTGIDAMSIGGGGGDAGIARAISVGPLGVSLGGSGGGGRSGGAVSVGNSGVVATFGANATGISVKSIGGGGGTGGAANLIAIGVGLNVGVNIGGSGGSGGNGGMASLVNDGEVTTAGAQSIGITAQSIGGGGGNGGSVWTKQLTVGVPISGSPTGPAAAALSVAVGGAGSSGGAGGSVDVQQLGAIRTAGAGAHGLVAQSVGGGGGIGGSAATQSLTLLAASQFTTGVAVGGAGGIGGVGGTVNVLNKGTIVTGGDNARGIIAQSIGGSGGVGGSALAEVSGAQIVPVPEGTPQAAPTTFGVATSVGGHGGLGAVGGSVTLTNEGTITSTGIAAAGIYAQSVGGGGGAGGSSQGKTSPSQRGTSAITIGGTGGSGNHGGSVTIANRGTVSTTGEMSYGIFAQSIGGGGGDGGNAERLTGNSLASAIGGDISALFRLISTLRSISADKWVTSQFTPSFTGNVTVGGNGGSGSHGGTVAIDNAGTLQTAGTGAHAIVAQSIGGGGGNGGSADSHSISTLTTTLVDALGTLAAAGANFRQFPETFGLNLNLGGRGGGSSNGGAVKITNSGMIETGGAGAAGIFAQSIGGGGGNGGSVGRSVEDIAKDLFSDANMRTTFLRALLDAVPLLQAQGGASLSFNVGGAGGSGGDAGHVEIVNGGQIATHGDQAPGIFAQTVGGGGGNAGSSHTALGNQSFNIGLNIGRGGGAGGHGGGGLRVAGDPTDYAVVIENGGRISTFGVDSAGILAQSVGGGGGRSASRFGGGAGVGNMPISLSGATKVGGFGANGHGGHVFVRSTGRIETSGLLSHAIMAQSIGGGGGAASLVFERPATGSHDIALGAETGQGRADGGKVKVAVDGLVRTSGDLAFGVLAQSVGAGGGYVAAAATQGALAFPMTLTLNATRGVQGWGQDVVVALGKAGDLTTTGRAAHGIVAQSIGAGGGIAALTTQPGLVSLNPVSLFSSVTYGDGGAVDVRVDGSVETYGQGSIGILAQSVGGGGGIAGDLSSISYDTGLVRSTPGNVQGAGGNGGAVKVAVGDNGWVASFGARAPAIVAMSLGGGAIFKDGGILLEANQGGWGANTKGGKVEITVGRDAVVHAGGVGAPAIVAVSMSASPDANNRSTPIAINIAPGAHVTSEQDAAILAISEFYTSVDNAGVIRGKIAGRSTNGGLSITNTGTMIGDILTAGDPFNSDVNNRPGGLLAMGTQYQTRLYNSGTINPGGAVGHGGSIATTRITSVFEQRPGGVYQADVNFGAGTADMISVASSGTAPLLAGQLEPLLQNPRPGVSLQVAHFDDRPTGDFSIKSATTAYSYRMQRSPDGRDLFLTVDGHFGLANGVLSADRSRVAKHIQALWDRGDTRAGAVFDAFTSVESLAHHGSVVDTIANDGVGARSANQINESFGFFNRLMSCPAFTGPGAALTEGDCNWARVGSSWMRRGSSAGDSGFRIRQTTLSLGAQREFAPGWFLGGAASYGFGRTSTAAGATSDNDSFIGGLTLKRQLGPWQFAAAVQVGRDMAKTSRRALGGLATSEPQLDFGGGRLRAAYQMDFGSWYAKPFVDLDLNYTVQRGHRESGAGWFDLAVHRSDRFTVMATPSLEIGARHDLDGMTLRSYLSAGVSILPTSDWSSKLHLAGFEAAPFTLVTGLPKTYGNVSAGLELVTAKGFELRAEYTARAASRYLDQSATLRAAYRF